MTHEEAVAKARDIANAVLAPHAVENDLTAKHTPGPQQDLSAEL
jgi:hypothetical protein